MPAFLLAIYASVFAGSFWLCAQILGQLELPTVFQAACLYLVDLDDSLFVIVEETNDGQGDNIAFGNALLV